jgi:tetratricopeptide (TPR) repeat protein
MLRKSQSLPRPSRSRLPTGPLRAPESEVAAPAEAGPPAALDPVAEARDRALAALAGMLFEEQEDRRAPRPAPRRGLQAVLRGSAGSPASAGVDPARIRLHLSQAVDAQTRGQELHSAEALDRAVRAGLDHAAAQLVLGLLFSRHDRLERAQVHLQHAVAHPDYALGARLLLGQVLQKLGRLEEAALEYLEALKLADALLVPEGQADELQQLYEPLIEAESRQADSEGKARLCENIAGLLLAPDWRERLARARAELPAGGDGGPPMPLGEMLTEARSSQIVESIARIHQLARAGHLRSAMEEAFYALHHAPTYLPLHIFMGELLLQQDRLAEAAEKFNVVAQAYSARGEAGRAIELLRRIIRIAPMDLAARRNLIQQLLAHGQVEAAVQAYLAMAGVYYDLAELESARQTFGEALRLADQARLGTEIKTQILHQMADIDLQSLDWRQALRVYEQIVELLPDDQRAWASLVEINFRLGQEARALIALKKYLDYLANQGRGELAVPFLEGLVDENPDQPALRRMLDELRTGT